VKEIETMAEKKKSNEPYVGSFKASQSLVKKVRIKCAKEDTSMSAKIEQLLKEFVAPTKEQV